MANHAPGIGALSDLFVRQLVSAAEPKHPHFAIRTQPRAEHQVRDRLLARGFSPVSLKFLPGFVFARFHAAQRLEISSMAGVHSIVGFAADFAGLPAPVDDEELEALVRVLESRLPFGPAPFPACGVPCRLKAGPLEGIRGVLMGTSDAPVVVLSLTLVQRSIAVSVEADWVGPFRPSY